MPTDILCLRPESDFIRVGVVIPPGPSPSVRPMRQTCPT